MDVLSAIERKYGFALPNAYRKMAAASWVTDDFLWIPEGEFLRPEEILEYQPYEYHKPGFVPFAFTGAGDHWCWWPERDARDAQAVVLCPHDDRLGSFYSPSFVAWLYQRILFYATHMISEERENEGREYLRAWAVRLAPFFPEEWCMYLRRISMASRFNGGFISGEEYGDRLRADVPYAQRFEEFVWME